MNANSFSIANIQVSKFQIANESVINCYSPNKKQQLHKSTLIMKNLPVYNFELDL